MLKKPITIMIVAIMCIAPFSGGFAVVCHGEDGHVAIEAAVHDHCSEPEVEISHGHREQRSCRVNCRKHCSDSPMKSDIAISAKRKSQTETSQILMANVSLLKTSNPKTSETRDCFSWNVESTSFFTPLSSIIILA